MKLIPLAIILMLLLISGCIFPERIDWKPAKGVQIHKAATASSTGNNEPNITIERSPSGCIKVSVYPDDWVMVCKGYDLSLDYASMGPSCTKYSYAGTPAAGWQYGSSEHTIALTVFQDWGHDLLWNLTDEQIVDLLSKNIHEREMEQKELDAEINRAKAIYNFDNSTTKFYNVSNATPLLLEGATGRPK